MQILQCCRYFYVTNLHWPLELTTSDDGLDIPRWAGLNVLCKELREHGYVRKLWSDFEEHCKRVVLMTHAADYAACLEVCPDTYERSGDVQLHFHLYVRANWKMYVRDMADFAFQIATPNRAHCIGGVVLEKRSRHSWAGYFYRCVDKHGCVERTSNRLQC